MIPPLTPRQYEVLIVLRNFFAEHGYPPTLREIASLLGIRSPATVHRHLNALVSHGLVERLYKGHRSYWPTDRGGTRD